VKNHYNSPTTPRSIHLKIVIFPVFLDNVPAN
jgi:hypothetical protein